MTGVLAAMAGTIRQDVISITNQTISDFSGGTRTATAGYQLNSNGQAQSQINATFSNLEQWCTPTSEAGNYEVFVGVLSGSLSSGTTGSWLALSTTRTWTCTATVGSSQICTIEVSIRRTGTTTTLDTATIELQADAQF